jgi:hypothetical protein
MWPDGGYVMQSTEEVKSSRLLARIAEALYPTLPHQFARDRSADTLL